MYSTVLIFYCTSVLAAGVYSSIRYPLPIFRTVKAADDFVNTDCQSGLGYLPQDIVVLARHCITFH